MALVCLTVSPISSAQSDGLVQGTGINSSIKFEPNEDYDEDGLSNQQEDKMGLNILEEDTDYDQLPDGVEISKYKTDPTESDSDQDALDDGDEILELNLDPLNADENQNNIIDGKEKRTVPLIENDFGLKGNVTSVGSIYGQYTIENNPIIMLNNIQASKIIYFDTLNKGLHFNLEIPLKTPLKEPILLIYRNKSGKLEPVKKQAYHPESKVITAEFIGGGALVLTTKQDYEKSKIPSHATTIKPSHVPAGKNIKIANIPGLTIASEKLNQVITDRKGKVIKDKSIIVFKEKRNFNNEILDGGPKEKKAFYKVEKLYSDGNTTYATLSSVSTESGNQPTIMVHGLNSNTARWGYDKLWQNDDPIPEADEYINSYESFTGREYADGYDSSYGNYDVHYLGDAGDTADVGWQLNVDFAYTPNIDLFGFNYEHNGHVGEGATWLRHYIGDLESLGYINSYDDINLIAHSKGGLVSRYLIENLGYSYYVDRLLTFGTPHFGSDRVFFGTDMDRYGSELWGTDTGDDYCNQFTNNHDFTLYFAIGAWEKDDGIPDAIENKFLVAPNLNGTPNNVNYSYHDAVTDLFNQHGMYFSSTPEIEDTWVNMDSALGSDDDKMDNNGISPGSLPKINMHKRWYIFDDIYGDHSEMTDHADTDNITYSVLSGGYD